MTAVPSSVATALLAVLASPALAASLTPEEASAHVGETATVCGVVASTHVSARSPAAPTFLNLGKPYPNQPFTIVIFDRDRARFGTPESSVLHQRICATGMISRYRGRPEMILSDPAQLQR